MMHTRAAGVLLLLALGACARLPSDFERLPLEKKVDVYKTFLQRHGHPRISARSQISGHGWEAALLMADHLDGEKHGLPEREAIEIIYLVQARGCSLKGTPAEEALEKFLSREPRESADALLGRVTLEAIQANIVRPEGARHDGPRSPCQAGGPRKP